MMIRVVNYLNNAGAGIIGLFCFLACSQPSSEQGGNGAVAPQDAVKTFQLQPGFKIELVVAEPLVADPVDMEIDEMGRMFVVEMHGYPLDKSGSGAIRLITDTDKDGKFDKSEIFADKLVLPNGVMRWKKGILVSDAPNIYYFEDTDGDGKADIRDTMLTGFSLSNPHINVNNPLYGIDNWIHLAHRGAITTRNYENIFGDKGEEIYFPGITNSPKLPKNADSRSVRFQPDQQKLETTSGRAQFGHTFDMFGHHLFGDNQNHAFSEALGAPYISRNPELPIGEATQAISDHGAAAEIYQITTNPERQMFSGVGVMTSASGITANLGGLFPAPFDSSVTFICESVSNLVHADKLKDSASNFVASRVGQPGKEFLASTDAWFRPVNLYVGPDGALYVVDYYRQIIEHPEWMSDEAIKAGGLYNGKDKGRIYRIVPDNTAPAEWIKGLSLGQEPASTLVKYLESPNIWWRINAQRLLVDRRDTSEVGSLENMTRKSTPAGRLHAMWTLEGLGRLSSSIIRERLKDENPGIRGNAIKLAEIHLAKEPALAEALYELQDDPDTKVTLQLASTIGFLEGKKAEEILHKILFRNINDNWIQLAVLSARSSRPAVFLNEVLSKYKENEPAYATLVQRLTNSLGSKGSSEVIAQLVQKASDRKSAVWQAPLLSGLADGLRNRKPSPMNDRTLELVANTFFVHPSSDVRKASLKLLRVAAPQEKPFIETSIKKASLIAADTSQTVQKRSEALNFISLKDPTPYSGLLKTLMTPQQHPSIQLAALQTMAAIPGLTAGKHVLQVWPSLSPSMRDAAFNMFLSDTTRMTLLLDAVENGTVASSSLGWGRSTKLMGEDNDKIRNRARALFANKDQEKIVAGYQAALKLEGVKENGKKIFQQNCGLCHQVRGQLGIKYGPDLGTVQSWHAKDIMANILDPNSSIAVGFDLWKVSLKSGENLQGIITAETSSAIDILTGPEQKRSINRQEISSLEVMNMSPMPVLTQQLDHQKMADLLAFLRQPDL